LRQWSWPDGQSSAADRLGCRHGRWSLSRPTILKADRPPEEIVTAIRITLQVLLVLTSLFLTVLILLHKGRGGGLSDMFGGGATSSMGSSGVAERNLNRFTVAVALLWAAAIVLLGILERFSSQF
jgi:preprotein translocase subunit SecG